MIQNFDLPCLKLRLILSIKNLSFSPWGHMYLEKILKWIKFVNHRNKKCDISVNFNDNQVRSFAFFLSLLRLTSYEIKKGGSNFLELPPHSTLWGGAFQNIS